MRFVSNWSVCELLLDGLVVVTKDELLNVVVGAGVVVVVEVVVVVGFVVVVGLGVVLVVVDDVVVEVVVRSVLVVVGFSVTGSNVEVMKLLSSETSFFVAID